MSAIYSFETSRSVILLTDGAVYDASGKLTAIRRKVITSNRVPFAIAMRGDLVFAEDIASVIMENAEQGGFDFALDMVRYVTPALVRDDDDVPAVEIVVAGIDQKSGSPRHMVFSNVPVAGRPALVLDYPGPELTAIPSDGRAAPGLAGMGIRSNYQGETPEHYFEECGPQIFAYWRKVKSPASSFEKFHAPETRTGEGQYLIGGQLDMTVVTAAGATTKTIHRWNDRIGALIDPSKDRPLEQSSAGMNRQQRRAAAKRAA